MTSVPVSIGSIFASFKPTNKLPIPKATAPNIAAINTAVINLKIPTGLTNCKTPDDRAIANEIATITIGSIISVPVSIGSIFASFKPTSKPPIPKATAPNIAAINTAVINLKIPTGLTPESIKEESVIAVAIATVTRIMFAISPALRSFIWAIFSNAIATNGSAIAKANTERKFIPPTNLKAIPIASTPTAIIIIDANPSFNFDPCLGSVAPSKGPFFSAGLFLLRAIIVS